MSRYYFHLHNEVELADENGSEWPDDDAAILHAARQARSVAAADVNEGRLDLRHHITIVGEDGRQVAVVTFGEAVTVRF